MNIEDSMLYMVENYINNEIEVICNQEGTKDYKINKSSYEKDLKYLEDLSLNDMEKIKDMCFDEEIRTLLFEKIHDKLYDYQIIKENDSKLVYDNLKAISENKEHYNYNIDSDFSDYIHYVKMGRTPKEKLQIFIMCYVVNVTLEELQNWDIIKLLEYIKETNQYFEEDRDIIYECCNEIVENNDTIKKIIYD